MTDDLAEQLEAARTAFAQDGHDARLPPSVQQKCYQMPSQFLIQVHAERCTAEKANTFARARKTVIAAGTKHHSASAVSLLDVVSLEQCKFGINNNQGAARARGKALLLRRCKETGSYRTTGLHILAEDSQGWMVPVLILNASSQYEVLLQPDTVFRTLPIASLQGLFLKSRTQSLKSLGSKPLETATLFGLRRPPTSASGQAVYHVLRLSSQSKLRITTSESVAVIS